MAFGPQWFPFLGAGAHSCGLSSCHLARRQFPRQRPVCTAACLSDGDAHLLPVRVRRHHGHHPGWIGARAHELHRLDDLLPGVDDALVYAVGAFSIWGGGWLASLGVADFSGGYVIHLAAGTSGFVAAAVVSPKASGLILVFPPNSLLVTLIGAGILQLGWNGFNGGDPYFANADAGSNCTATPTPQPPSPFWCGRSWTRWPTASPPVLGAVNGMIAGLVAITPGARLCRWLWRDHHRHRCRDHSVDGHELAARNQLHDARGRHASRGVFSTHGIAGLTGGLLDRPPRQSRHAAIYRHR